MAPTVVYGGKMAALAVAMAVGHTRRSRHNRIRNQFTRELVAAGVIAVQQIPTAKSWSIA